MPLYGCTVVVPSDKRQMDESEMEPESHQTYTEIPVQHNTTEPQIITTSGGQMKTRESDVDVDTLPRLHFQFRWFFLVTYIIFLLILNVLIPCLLFYILREGQSHFTCITKTVTNNFA